MTEPGSEPLIVVPPCTGEDGSSPLEATGRTLNWGVIATGNIAASVTADIGLLPDARLHAVSSRSRGRAEQFATKFGFTTSYYDGGHSPLSGYEQLLADPDVDVVYVATPHGQHRTVAGAALQAGKHVLCEKSLTINAREAAELIELAETNQRFLMEAVWTRFMPSVQRAWQIVRSGELGEIQWVQADLGFPAPYDPKARIWALDDGGGALLDLTVYPLTWAFGVLGRPESYTVAGSLNSDGVDRQNALQLTYSSGAQAQLTSSLTASSPRTATICGAKGWLRTNAPLHNPTELTIETMDAGARAETIGQIGNGYVYEVREATRCIQAGLIESPTMPRQDSLETMKFFDAVRADLGVRYPND
ncbi:Gfo/Idh/MocA family protein [Arthrobacter castelli]|uniref:Gfo/Idh/MocA family protein n=1 Tax=Arthrobacter castelli TaxID=271431 RepID=UPI0003F5BB9D|nr:Gfo/Idh/MocA family oxidoreductase [Arthrobacter castelli]